MESARRTPSRPRAAALVAGVLLLLLGAAAPVGAAPSGGGQVLPSTAQPHGWGLDRITAAHALFSTSGQDVTYYPDTPFQVLFVDPSTAGLVETDGGIVFTGTNDTTVAARTPFFVPIWNASDSPPVLGTFPTSTDAAGAYFFDADQLGARDFTVTVDGQPTAVGRSDVSSPVTSPVPLLDGGGHHIVTLGVFLTPMAPGTHEVTISGGLYGPLVEQAYDVAFFAADFTYTVTVVPGRAGTR